MENAKAELADVYRQKLNEIIEPDAGLPHPNWRKLYPWLKECKLDHGLKNEFWDVVIEAWLEQLVQALGGSYAVSESPNFFLLSWDDDAACRRMLVFMEQSLKKLRKFLGELALKDYTGRFLVLQFGDYSEYWRYFAHFHREGTHGGSAGAFISGTGYQHIILAPQRIEAVEHTLYHEMIHNQLSHLRLPQWLDEGLTRKVQIAGGHDSPIRLKRKEAQQHWDYWNAETIQDFWSGEAFHVPGEPQKLGYELAELIFELIEEQSRRARTDFREFAAHANRTDLGTQAAVDYLELSLGEIAGKFLGPGNWEPGISLKQN